MTTQIPVQVRRAADRGHGDHGWLDSRHTFSFGDYYDPARMGFRSLRVINDDHVAAGGGFPTHPHRDMEIFSYVLGGTLAHQDSLGNRRVLKPGEIQLMRAGSGVRHSEFNPSATEPAHFLQVWITPHTRGLAPAYSEWLPQPGRENDAKTLVISADGRDGSAEIAQDASIYRIKLAAGRSTSHELASGRGLWLHLAKGGASAGGHQLNEGDSISLEQPASIEIVAGDEPVEAILFDLG